MYTRAVSFFFGVLVVGAFVVRRRGVVVSRPVCSTMTNAPFYKGRFEMRSMDRARFVRAHSYFFIFFLLHRDDDEEREKKTPNGGSLGSWVDEDRS